MELARYAHSLSFQIAVTIECLSALKCVINPGVAFKIGSYNVILSDIHPIGSILVSGVNMYIREINTQSLVKSLSGQVSRLSSAYCHDHSALRGVS